MSRPPLRVPLPRPGLTAAEMAQADEAMARAGVGLLQMAELAGAALARAVGELAVERGAPRRCVVLAGPGGNGAGGLTAARQLLGRGFEVRVGLPAGEWSRPEVLDLAGQLEALGADVQRACPDLEGAGVLLDALLGYRTRGAPREPLAACVRAATDSNLPVVANDIPTGLDPDTGRAAEPCIAAAVTVALAYPKAGLLLPHAAPRVGRLRLAHVGVPHAVYARFGVDPGALFARDTLVDVG